MNANDLKNSLEVRGISFLRNNYPMIFHFNDYCALIVFVVRPQIKIRIVGF